MTFANHAFYRMIFLMHTQSKMRLNRSERWAKDWTVARHKQRTAVKSFQTKCFSSRHTAAPLQTAAAKSCLDANTITTQSQQYRILRSYSYMYTSINFQAFLWYDDFFYDNNIYCGKEIVYSKTSEYPRAVAACGGDVRVATVSESLDALSVGTALVQEAHRYRMFLAQTDRRARYQNSQSTVI